MLQYFTFSIIIIIIIIPSNITFFYESIKQSTFLLIQEQITNKSDVSTLRMIGGILLFTLMLKESVELWKSELSFSEVVKESVQKEHLLLVALHFIWFLNNKENNNSWGSGERWTRSSYEVWNWYNIYIYIYRIYITEKDYSSNYKRRVKVVDLILQLHFNNSHVIWWEMLWTTYKNQTSWLYLKHI